MKLKLCENNTVEVPIYYISKSTYLVEDSQLVMEDENYTRDSSNFYLEEAKRKLREIASQLYQYNQLYSNVKVQKLDDMTLKIFYTDNAEEYYDLYEVKGDPTIVDTNWIEYLRYGYLHPLINHYEVALNILNVFPPENYSGKIFYLCSNDTGEILYEIDLDDFNDFMNNLLVKYLKDRRSKKDDFYINKIALYLDDHPFVR